MAGILFDLDGVLYEGGRPIAGASEAISWFQASNIPHLFLTNTTSRPRTALVDRLAHMGINVPAAKIFTPPVAAVHWLAKHTTGKIALFVPEATRQEFKDLPHLSEDVESGASAVILGDLGERWDFKLLNRAFRLLISEPKPPLIALGMTRYWRAADGLRLDVAPFVVALEHATGTKPIVLGKPAAPFYQAALELLQVPRADALMIGDDIRGDIEGAQYSGVRGILVKTGKFRPSDLKLGITPHAILDSIADLPTWWQANVTISQ